MISRAVVIETRLNSNSELVTYLKNSINMYSLIYRKIWYEMIKSDFNIKYKNLAEFQKHCRNIYDLHSRTINSIVHEIIAKKNATGGNAAVIRGCRTPFSASKSKNGNVI